MKRLNLAILVFLVLGSDFVFSADHWKIHDISRPNPAIITPGTFSSQAKPGNVPSDAVVLFDGKDLSQWRSLDGGPAKWIVKDGNMECVKGSGYIRTLRNFGDCQLHVEFSTPTAAEGKSQARGNSGVFLMGKYEVQVLDNYENPTYSDGQCSAIYGEYPPQVNACLKPGEWQTYDIIFHAPKFNCEKELLKPGTVTVFHNGVLTQDHVEILGPTSWTERLPYSWHPDKLPLALQDHGNPVRYRNIWVRELPAAAAGQELPRAEITVPVDVLRKYTGAYRWSPTNTLKVKLENDVLWVAVRNQDFRPVCAESETKFFSKFVQVELEFSESGDEVTFAVGGKVEGTIKKVK